MKVFFNKGKTKSKPTWPCVKKCLWDSLICGTVDTTERVLAIWNALVFSISVFAHSPGCPLRPVFLLNMFLISFVRFTHMRYGGHNRKSVGHLKRSRLLYLCFCTLSRLSVTSSVSSVSSEHVLAQFREIHSYAVRWTQQKECWSSETLSSSLSLFLHTLLSVCYVQCLFRAER